MIAGLMLGYFTITLRSCGPQAKVTTRGREKITNELMKGARGVGCRSCVRVEAGRIILRLLSRLHYNFRRADNKKEWEGQVCLSLAFPSWEITLPIPSLPRLAERREDWND